MAPSNSRRQRARRPSQHPVLLALTIVLTPALWIVFVATGNPHELLVGLIAAIATVVFTVYVCRFSSSDMQFRARDVVQCWRIPGYIVADAYAITAVLAKDLLRIAPAGNLYRVCGFDTGTHDPVRGARTVLAVVYATSTPNSIVIGVDPAQSRMLFHQLKATAVPRMIQSLGAKA